VPPSPVLATPASTAETTFQYRVRAINSAGASPASNIVEATTEPLTEAVGNLFPECWFVQALDGTGELIANEPAKVSWTGETSGQQRGVVARIDSATTLAEAGDFLEMAFITAGMPSANDLQYSLRFGHCLCKIAGVGFCSPVARAGRFAGCSSDAFEPAFPLLSIRHTGGGVGKSGIRA
jgi:hypothetical protein